MHGFLPVLLASALLAMGEDLTAAIDLLEESSLASFMFSDESVRWRDWSFSAQDLTELRRTGMLSFGSCSFVEPIEEMRSAGAIP
jgi:hypothetical protein